jgi:predicted ribosomally synthesized peptide with SipW-like signal peptide
VLTAGTVAGLLFFLAGVSLAYWSATDSSNPA